MTLRKLCRKAEQSILKISFKISYRVGVTNNLKLTKCSLNKLGFFLTKQKFRDSSPVWVQWDIKESNRSFYSVILRLSALLMVFTSESQSGSCICSFMSSLQAGRRKNQPGACQPSLFIFIRKTKTDPTELHLHFTNENCVTQPNLARS